MKSIFQIIIFTLVPFLGFCETVLVSIPPHKYFVEKIADDSINVLLLLPPGGSPHSYEPNARQILDSAKADIWFQVGEGFEERAESALKGHRPDLQVVDLRDGLDLIRYSEGESFHQCGHAHHCFDPHIWLSPRLAKKQAEKIAQVLSLKFPEKRLIFQKNLEIFLKKLDQLDLEITAILKPLENRKIMVSHPAYAYFCRDYGLTQHSVEFEGKDPTPRQVTDILNEARKYQIKTIFVQVQHSSKGARLIATEVGAKIVDLDPLEEDYLQNMRKIARSFAQ